MKPKTRNLRRQTCNLKLGSLRRTLAAVCLASLAACGGQQSQEGKPRLLVLNVGTLPSDRQLWEDAVALFKTDHPDCVVDVRHHKDDDYTKLHLPQALRSRHRPDIYFQWAGFAVHRDGGGGIARDLTAEFDAAWREQHDERAFRGTTHGGKYFMIPVSMDVSNVLWYRKSILAKHGIEPPRTWEAFVEACKKLKAAGVTPIVHGNQAGWPAGNWAAHMAETYLGIETYDAIGDPKSPARVPLDDPRIVKAVALLEELARLGAFNEDINTLDNNEGTGLFNRGAGAFHFDGGWIIEEFVEPDDVGLLRQPVLPGDVADPDSILATASGYMIHARSPHPDLALELLRAYTALPIQKKAVEIGRMSTIKAALKSAKTPHQRAVLDLLAKSSTWVAAPDISWRPADAEEFNRAVAAVVGGRATALEALRAAAKNIAR